MDKALYEAIRSKYKGLHCKYRFKLEIMICVNLYELLRIIKVNKLLMITPHKECCNFLRPCFLTMSKIYWFLINSSLIDAKLAYSFLLLTLCSLSYVWALRSNRPNDLVDDWAAAKFCSTSALDSLSLPILNLFFSSILCFFDSLGFFSGSFSSG